MSEKTTPLDAVIAEKLPAYIEAEAQAREARDVSRRRDADRDALGIELQKLLIARSVLRDGKAYGFGDANVELNKLRVEAKR